MADGPEAAARKGRLRAALGWGGTLVLMTYLVMTTDLTMAWRAFMNADHTLFVLTLVISTFGSYILDVVTVRELLNRVGIRVGFGEFLKTKGASYLLNIVNYNLALVLMVAMIRKRTDRGWGASGSPFLLLNFVDLSVFGALALLAVAAGETPFEPTATIFVALFAAGALVAPPILCGLTRLEKLPGILGRVFSHDILAAFRHLEFRSIPWLMFLRSLLILLYAVMGWAFLHAFGVDVPILTLMVFMPILSLIAFVPVSVSGLGSTQVVMREFLAPYVLPAVAVTSAAREAVIDAYSTSTIVSMILLRAVIGLVCLPWVSRTLAAARPEQEP